MSFVDIAIDYTTAYNLQGRFTGRDPMTGRFIPSVEIGDDEETETLLLHEGIVGALDWGEQDEESDTSHLLDQVEDEWWADQEAWYEERDRLLDKYRHLFLHLPSYEELVELETKEWVEQQYRKQFPNLWFEEPLTGTPQSGGSLDHTNRHLGWWSQNNSSCRGLSHGKRGRRRNKLPRSFHKARAAKNGCAGSRPKVTSPFKAQRRRMFSFLVYCCHANIQRQLSLRRSDLRS